MGFKIATRGDFNKTRRFLQAMQKLDIRSILEAQGQRGVAALAAATPVETGLAANSWTYLVEGGKTNCRITWMNADIENGFPVAIMLQYGYGTGTGGYVAGRDYINPAMRPVFDSIADTVWKAVTSA